MRTCKEYEDMISAFIDGALAEEDRAALMEHMGECPVCQEYFDQQIALHDALMADAEAIQVPEGFALDVMARVRFTPQEKQKRPVVRWRQWAALAACCTIAALALWRGAAGMQESNRTNRAADCPAVVTEGREDAAGSVAENPGEASGTGGFVPESASEQRAAPTVPPASPVQEEALHDASDAADSSDTGGLTAPQSEPEPQAAMPEDENKAAAEQQTVEESAVRSQTEPAPAANTPSLTSLYDGGAVSGQSEAAKAPYTILTASPVAAAWVEETLGLPWTAGGRYELTAGEYAQLREALEAAEADFTEQPGDENAEEFLLLAENSSETD